MSPTPPETGRTHEPVVFLLGHNAVTRLGIARALYASGCRVRLISVLKHHAHRLPVDAYSRCVEDFHQFLHRNQGDVIRFLEEEGRARAEAGTPKGIILPDSDFTVALIDRNRSRLEPFFLMPGVYETESCRPDDTALPGGIVAWMDKIRQKEAARSVGLTVAEGWTIRVEDGVYTLPEGLRYPCFPKPLASISGGKHGLKRCDNETELHQVLSHFAGMKDTRVLIEEYREIRREYAVVGLATAQHVYLPGLFDLDHISGGAHKGVAKQGLVLPPDGHEDLFDRLQALIRWTGYRGLFDVDLYDCGGTLYFGEINFRSGASSAALQKQGINLPGLWVRSLMAEAHPTAGVEAMPEPSAVRVTAPFRYTNERTCLDDWLKGFSTTREFRAEIADREEGLLYSPDDPRPWEVFHRRLGSLRLQRFLHLI